MKFKYLKERDIDIEEMEDYSEVPNPLPYQNLPDGEYLIRGNQKEHRKEYWKVDNKWFLIDESTKDNGHSVVDALKYMLFPSLPEKEWDIMEKIPWNRLTFQWRRYVWAHRHWKELKEMLLGIRRGFLQVEKHDYGHSKVV